MSASSESDETDGAEALVRAFYEAWSRLDVEELMSYFAETSVWHSVPESEPLRGAMAIRQVIEWVVEDWTADARVSFELLNLATRGKLVFSERVDHVESGDRRVTLPVVGIFAIVHGKIAEWRDYFDGAALYSGLPPRIPWPPTKP
jgi:limonene-1,2-epoxide hydrolase